MANYSYNELKQKFLDLCEDGMPTDFPAFQRPLGDDVSDADSKIYTDAQMKSLRGFFMNHNFYNSFCGRINCWNINLKHIHTLPENKSEYVEKIVELLEEWEREAPSKLNQVEMNQLTSMHPTLKKQESFWNST